MTTEEKLKIKTISKQFASGFLPDIKINGSGWLIVDPLSAYLNAMGFENTLQQVPETEKHSMVLIITFKDGTQFIPTGKDLKSVNPWFKNYMWLDK